MLSGRNDIRRERKKNAFEDPSDCSKNYRLPL